MGNGAEGDYSRWFYSRRLYRLSSGTIYKENASSEKFISCIFKRDARICFHWWTDCSGYQYQQKQRYPHLRPGPLPEAQPRHSPQPMAVRSVNGRDYTLTGRMNKNIRTASVTIKGKENITVSVTKNSGSRFRKTRSIRSARLKYKISQCRHIRQETVVFTGATDKAARKALTIPTTVKIGGRAFVPTAIGTSAMSGQKKLTTVKIRSEYDSGESLLRLQ